MKANAVRIQYPQHTQLGGGVRTACRGRKQVEIFYVGI